MLFQNDTTTHKTPSIMTLQSKYFLLLIFFENCLCCVQGVCTMVRPIRAVKCSWMTVTDVNVPVMDE